MIKFKICNKNRIIMKILFVLSFREKTVIFINVLYYRHRKRFSYQSYFDKIDLIPYSAFRQSTSDNGARSEQNLIKKITVRR